MKSSWPAPSSAEIRGKFVTLRPYDSSLHAEDLFQASHGSPEKEAVWNFLFYGPFSSSSELAQWYEKNLNKRTDPLTWAVIAADGRASGITSLLNIVPAHGRAEIGHVWLTPSLHRGKSNTETQFLLLKHLFDDLHYRRVEWKCDSLNHPSRTTAARMGFVYEGRFRQHMMVKGRNRDTDWFAMTDKDWPLRKQNFERWLYSGEKVSLAELNNG